LGKVSVGQIGTTPVSQPQGLIFDGSSGDLNGGSGNFSGSIVSDGDMGPVTIAGTLFGVGNNSATVFSGGNLASLTIEGSVIGGSGVYLGQAVHGQIVAVQKLGPVVIAGNVSGGSGDYSGTITGGTVTTVHIGQDLSGGIGAATGSIFSVSTDIGSVTIDGSISSLPIDSSAGLSEGPSGSIYAARTLGPVLVRGSVDGVSGGEVTIGAGGMLNAKTDAQALAIKSVRVLGEMTHTQIIAGFDITTKPINGDVQIGTVEVGTTTANLDPAWSDVDVIAGFMKGGSGVWGTGSDTIAGSGAQTALLSKIAKIVIHGTIIGDSSHHGIDAELVGSIVVNGVAEPLHPGPHNDFFPLNADASRMTVVFEAVPPAPLV
jgi:hypothetical protein